MFDVFYTGSKPNLFAHEQPADSIEEARAKSRTQYCWYLSGENDYTHFCFDLIPPHWEHDHVYVWPSQWQQNGQVYLTPKHNPGPTHYCTDQSVVTTRCDVDIFVVDANNKNRELSFETVHNKHNHAQQIRGMGNWASIIQKCCNKSTSEYVWIVSSDYDYTDFDFTWYPDPSQRTMFHIFGTPHQKWANVFRVHREEFLNQCTWHDDIKQFPLLNFVNYQTVQLWSNNREIVYVDFGNSVDFTPDLDHKTTRFFSTWLETLSRICERTDSEYIWVTSSICDYSNFDFGWEPEPWQADMLHVFASNDQAEGDTFLVPVQRFKAQQQRLELLGWFDTINYVKGMCVPAYAWPVADSVHDITTPYAWIVHAQHGPVDYTPSNWKKPNLHVFNTSGSVTLCPRDCKMHFQQQLYDYPYILRHKHENLVEKPHDIVFISYDEKNADLNYEILLKQQSRTKRLHGVEGMENALYQAAVMSETDWFFAVFAKTRLHEDFDFSYLPDRLQGDKHYIFNCKNMVNGLEYGHMGVILYNRQMVIDSHDYDVLGLDYTMSHRHDVVPETSCYGVFNTSPFETWRSAFRETIKLAQQMDHAPTVETQYRLKVWCEHAQGDYAEYCTAGALHGVEFYNQHKDNMIELKKTFRWNWLQNYFNSKFT